MPKKPPMVIQNGRYLVPLRREKVTTPELAKHLAGPDAGTGRVLENAQEVAKAYLALDAHDRRRSSDDDRWKRDHLRRRIEASQTTTQTRLLSDLTFLVQKIEAMKQGIEKGDGVDVHLIVNVSSMTADLERWNLLRELHPYVAEDPKIKP